jgi:hypothetical protein
MIKLSVSALPERILITLIGVNILTSKDIKVAKFVFELIKRISHEK